MIELRGIEKYFPANGIQALDGADFELREGEIHALVGENGAGKSTLMHILAGYLKPSAGIIKADGKTCQFDAPADALATGIGMVRQHPNLTEGFKVWEDCVLGAEGEPGFFLSPRKAKDRVLKASVRWGFDLPVEKGTETLTVSQRQKAAILALILKNARYLVFDEPTAVLTAGETESLFALFKSLRDEGKGIGIISHKLDETLGLADRITVIRRGKTAPPRPVNSIGKGDLIALIFGGKDRGDGAKPEKEPPSPGADTEGEILRVEGLAVRLPGRPFIHGISFVLPRGQIFGIAGVRDSGLETLELTLTGFLKPSEGAVFLKKKNISGGGIGAFREAGGAYLGSDRLGCNLAPNLSLADNLIVHVYSRARRGLLGMIGLMRERVLKRWIEKILKQAMVRVSAADRADSFSGGTLQRILLAREFAENGDLILLSEPSWGLDERNRKTLVSRLRLYAAAKKGVLLFSTDVDELISVCDEILVLRDGAVSERIKNTSLREDAPSPDHAGGTAAAVKNRINGAMVGFHA
ncbi:MAG: ATP-binding cassette domain-containing protein [Treponema sp.]|nr:ATP-binding cassette domain-containing protein [Treponema sp.]